MRPSRIALVLVLAVALRLVHVSAPILGVHSWRQADTAAMARNFHENGYRFLYPQVDWGGSGPGYVECELPAFPYAVALAYSLFGPWEGWGRLLAALLSALTAYLLYRLARDAYGDERAALAGAFVFAVLPLSVYYGRAFMPEAAMLCASVAALHAFDRWTTTGSRRWYLLAAAATATACLLKLPCLYLGLPLLYLAWRTWGPGLARRADLWLFLALVLAPVALWYAHAHALYRGGGVTFGIWEYGSDKWGNWRLVASGGFWNGVLSRSLAERHLTWAGVPLALAGLLLPRRGRRAGLVDWWLLALGVYLVIVARGNYVHEYYQLPFLPPLSIAMGRAIAAAFAPGARRRARAGAAMALVVAILVLSGTRLASYWRREDPARSPLYRLARQVDRRIPPQARIVALDEGNPTLLYLAHRKGWHASPGDLAPDSLRARAAEGAMYAAGLRRDLRGSGATQNAVRAGLARDLLAADPEGFLLQLTGPGAPGTSGR
ncbi:MAG TPA: glycosyltransferase family 39 protein [Candidatus Eisenbacteria bacterium]|nr:glycosyltransferase family 39 protein [Candidatus Eisenbacteria bacterium]